jgi:hypothetical protein
LSIYFRVMMIFECFLVRCSWSRMETTGCKPGYPSLMMIMAKTNPGTSLRKALSWWSMAMLHCWLHLYTM